MAKKTKASKQPLAFRISFGKTAYVGSCGNGMLDCLEHCGIPVHMTGEGMFLTDYDALVEYLEGDNVDTEVESYLFLNQVRTYLDKLPDDIIGDVVFVS